MAVSLGRSLTYKFTLFAGPLCGVRVNGRDLIERHTSFGRGVTKPPSLLEEPVGDFLPPTIVEEATGKSSLVSEGFLRLQSKSRQQGRSATKQKVQVHQL
jgi:hypothetical protein